MLWLVFLGDSSLHLDRLFLEARYVRRASFLDHVGAIVDDIFPERYSEANISATEVQFGNEEDGGARMVVSDQAVRVAREEHPIPEDEAFGDLVAGLIAVEKFVGSLTIEYIGVRQVLLLPLPDVAEATRLFRETFFDYRQEPYVAFGDEPVEAKASVRYRVDEGTCRIEATAIYLNEERNLGGAALLLDVDRSIEGSQDVWTIGTRAQDLLTDGHQRAVDFVARLKSQTSPVDGRT